MGVHNPGFSIGLCSVEGDIAEHFIHILEEWVVSSKILVSVGLKVWQALIAYRRPWSENLLHTKKLRNQLDHKF